MEQIKDVFNKSMYTKVIDLCTIQDEFIYVLENILQIHMLANHCQNEAKRSYCSKIKIFPGLNFKFFNSLSYINQQKIVLFS